MLLVLLKTAIFTAIVPYAVGLWLPTQVPSAFSESTIGIEPERWKIILSLPLLFAGALALCFSGRSLLFFIWCLLPRAFNCSSCCMKNRTCAKFSASNIRSTAGACRGGFPVFALRHDNCLPASLN